MNKKGLGIIGVFAVILLFTVTVALIMGAILSGESGNIAVIPIEGTISTGTSYFGGSASSSSIMADIEDAELNPEIEAIVFRIDSPGGAVVATREIANAIKETEKPTVCWLRETAASGGYWIASSCDKIVADEYTLTGSIGVIASFVEFSGLMDDYNVSYVRLVSGERKDMGSPFREPTKQEVDSLQKMVDEIKIGFVDAVKENRNLSDETVKLVSDGRIMLGKEAFSLGLVDVLGGKNEVTEVVSNLTGSEDISYVFYEKEFSFGELMAGFFGESMANRFMEDKVTISAK